MSPEKQRMRADLGGARGVGDGGLTDALRRALQACPHVQVVTIPRTRFFLPDEEPGELAVIISEAVTQPA